MNLPKAQLKHQSQGRLRVRVPSQKGDAAFFQKLKDGFADFPGLTRLVVNPSTGSVLFLGEKVDPHALDQHSSKKSLFRLNKTNSVKKPLPNRSMDPMAALERNMREWTQGSLDLFGLVFYALLGTGAYQILRGNFGAPPWYTAFWYAFGVYTKQLIDISKENSEND